MLPSDAWAGRSDSSFVNERDLQTAPSSAGGWRSRTARFVTGAQTTITSSPLRLIRENQAVAVEDLAVAGLARTQLAKSVHDVAWALFVRLLVEKAAQHGRQVVKIGRWVPTSQVCSACGANEGPKPLGVRTWTCSACGTAHGRDTNAALNILDIAVAAGLAETQNACGADVSPSPAGGCRR